MKDPCERCIEYDLCKSKTPCKRKEAYARWKLKCKEIREHTLEIMARAREEKNGRKERDN